MEAHSDAVTAVGYSFIEVVDALESAGAAFVGLLNDLEPADADLRVPGLEWTVGETAVHMLTVLWRGTIDRRRVDSVAEMGELNALAISEVDERRPSVLADKMEEFLGSYIEALGGIDPARVVKIIGAVRADIPTALSCLLFDLLVHGYDIAGATGRDWSIEPAIAALDLRGCLPATSPWVLPDVINGPRRDVVVGFATTSWALAARAGDGSFTVRPVAAQHADAIVDPVETLLAIAGRRVATDPAAARLASWFGPF